MTPGAIWTSILLATFLMLTVPPTRLQAQEGVSETYASIRKSIAFVLTAKGGKPLATGTAFCVYSDARHSIFITNRHVVAGSDGVVVLIQEPRPVTAKARVIRVGAVADIAVLDVARGGIPPLILSGDTPEEGTRVGIAGYPKTQVLFGQLGLGLTPSLHVGIVNALPGAGALIQFDAQVEPGNSGGPLFDASTGIVYGIVTGKVKKTSESNIAIPVAFIVQIAQKAHVPLAVERIASVNVAAAGPAAKPTPEPTPSPAPTPAWDVAACRTALDDFREAYDAWNGSYNRYTEATRKTSSAASGATNQYGASVVGVYVALEIRAINSVVKDEEPKLMRAQRELETSGAPLARLTDNIVNHIRTGDMYAQQWSYSRQRAVAAANAGQRPSVDSDAFERGRSEQDALSRAMSDLKFAPKCEPK